MNARLSVVFVLVIPLVACSTTSGAVDSANRAAADALIPPEKEEQLGQRFSNQVEEELTLHDDEQVNAYVRDLGEAAVEAAGDDVPDAIEFEFHVVDDDETVNAFAGPGGQIYFYTGLLKQADNTAEVMGVMAHEVAHVTERHVAERLVANYGVQALANAALGDNPGLLAKLGASVAAQGFLLKYSRDHETEADRVGFHFIADTKYDPSGMMSFFEKLSSEGAQVPQILSSHPNPENRISYLKDIRRTYQGSTGNQFGKDKHQKILDRLD